MARHFRYVLFFLLFVLASCQTNNKTEENKTEADKKSVPASNNLPSLDIDTYTNLIENCDFIDYIFHIMPFSMSQEDRASIVGNLRFISSQPVATLNPSCKSMARIMYSINGEIETEADIYFSDSCTYFVFVKDEKPYAANLMTQEGAVFYTNVLNQIKASNPNG